MQRFRSLLLDVWREACRHIEIRESTATIAGLLSKHMPLAQVIVCQLAAEQASFATIAVATPQGNDVAGVQWRKLDSRELRQVTSWCQKGRPVRRGKRPAGVLELMLPQEIETDAMAVPLPGHGPAGVLQLIARPRSRFDDTNEEILDALREPFSVALENDRRLHEMAILREAAEADRGTLLRRLGRTELSDTVIGQQSGLRQVMERVGLVSNSDVPVLILGETGTGKELVARAIHTRSARHAGPFIRVNCGAIPSELIDSHLFGHEKGSFTGASDQRPGWFERADGGTLFLDEIGELPLPAQVRLLRVLQDHQVERVGGQHSIYVDVRMVAATHRDLSSMVAAGNFREDLWYRINVFPILLPRLRDRIDDIPALTRHFSHRAAERFGLPYVEPSPVDLQMLMNYHWPGNIRELGAVIDRAAILGNGRTLEVVQSLGFSQPSPPNSAEGSDGHAGAPISIAAPSTTIMSKPMEVVPLDVAMRQHVERALRAAHGRIEGKRGAAALLRINPHTLRARMRKLGIDWRQFRPRDDGLAP